MLTKQGNSMLEMMQFSIVELFQLTGYLMIPSSLAIPKLDLIVKCIHILKYIIFNYKIKVCLSILILLLKLVLSTVQT